MSILKNAGTFEILSKTENVIDVIAKASRTCYKSEPTGPDSNIRLVKKLIERGHEAMLEHAIITVKFDNISRGFTHEMVRHRIASFGQESTRYVSYKNGIDFICPPSMDIKESEGFNNTVSGMYEDMLEVGYKPEDARQFLPIGIKSAIVVTANIREWRKIFELRCDKYAHWEIRGVMMKLLKRLQKDIEIVFDDFYFYDDYARKILPKNKILEIIADHNTANIEDQI